MFYDPSALLAFIRFNFILRRTFIELMHADLIATRAGIAKLEAADVHVIDCRSTGLSGAEPLTKIKKLADEWKQPFQKEYTERSVNQAFEKLLGLRADVENALEKNAAKVSDRLVIESAKGFSPESPNKTASAPAVVSAALPKGSSAEASQKIEAAQKNPPPEALDFEACMEKIWEQLIAT